MELCWDKRRFSRNKKHPFEMKKHAALICLIGAFFFHNHNYRNYSYNLEYRCIDNFDYNLNNLDMGLGLFFDYSYN